MPPADLRQWRHARPGQEELAARLAEFVDAFNLLGDGPRFMQDLAPLPGSPSGPDMLFIDSAGGNTARNNADLMVHRDRYGALELPLAAMALYAFQQFAPSGGAGNRTSMRGGGPLVTLANPGTGLWDLVWANVPFGQAATPEDLPWMKATRTSEKGKPTVTPSQAHPVEAFFGVPRRLRLEGEAVVTGVVQRPYGTNYELWQHPLSPYYRVKEGAELLPRHASGGRLPYRNWAGIVLAQPGDNLRLRARALDGFYDRFDRSPVRMIAAGWAMDNMKPKDFLWAELPLLPFEDAALGRAKALIEAADTIAAGLRRALPVVVAEGSAREAQLDQFWSATEGDFTQALSALTKDGVDGIAIAQGFLAAAGGQALAQFDALALPGLADGKIERAKGIVEARRIFAALIHGRSKPGRALWEKLDLTPPHPKKKDKEVAG